MSSPSFIAEPGQITPEWLTDRLRQNGHLPSGKVVDIQVNEKPKADRIANRIKVVYSADAPESAPKDMIFKHSANGRLSAQKPRYCAGVREGIFYSEIASTMPDSPVADCYEVGIDFDNG